jgi:hypothetical protein
MAIKCAGVLRVHTAGAEGHTEPLVLQGDMKAGARVEILKIPWKEAPSSLPLAQTEAARLLPNYSDSRLFTWRLRAIEVRFLEGELAPRTERYEAGRT